MRLVQDSLVLVAPLSVDYQLHEHAIVADVRNRGDNHALAGQLAFDGQQETVGIDKVLQQVEAENTIEVLVRNPVQGLEGIGVDDAVELAGRLLGGRGVDLHPPRFRAELLLHQMGEHAGGAAEV